MSFSKPLLPLTRDDIRRWFCTYEIPYGTFRSPNGQIYPWFHGNSSLRVSHLFILFYFAGIISRSYTEQILSSKPIGTYLIRINEKIFGYALSYRATDHCRHLLIEVVCSTSQDNKRGDPNQPHAYRFLGGAKYESFTQLVQLIEKYSVSDRMIKFFISFVRFRILPYAQIPQMYFVFHVVKSTHKKPIMLIYLLKMTNNMNLCTYPSKLRHHQPKRPHICSHICRDLSLTKFEFDIPIELLLVFIILCNFIQHTSTLQTFSHLLLNSVEQ